MFRVALANCRFVGNTEVTPSFALGATPEQLEDFNHSYRNWGQGTVRSPCSPVGEPAADASLIKSASPDTVIGDRVADS